MTESIEVKFVQTNYLTRRPCTICCGWTEKDFTLCEAKIGDCTIRVCEQCLKARNFDEELAASAAHHEQHAAFLRSLIGRLSVPTHAEWITEDRRATDEVYGPGAYDGALHSPEPASASDDALPF